jgi:hypothetical protein
LPVRASALAQSTANPAKTRHVSRHKPARPRMANSLRLTIMAAQG